MAGRTVFLVAVVVALGITLGGRASVSAAAPDEAAVRVPAASVAEAVRQSVEAGGSAYAGDCAGARSPDDLGKRCSKLAATQGDLTAIMTGRFSSEFTTWLFVLQTPAGWCVVASEPLNGSAMAQQIPWPEQQAGAACSSGASATDGAPRAG